MKNTLVLIVSLMLAISSCTQQKQSTINLSGEWQFQTDPEDKGIAEKWFSQVLPEKINLPGSMATNGKGNAVGYDTEWTGGFWINLKDGKHWYDLDSYRPYLSDKEFLFPFWLTPDKKYTGAAWYKKEIEIPPSWDGKVVELFLERCHWETQVWIDDEYIGKQNSLGTAHRYMLSDSITPGVHTITICVDNRIKEINVGQDAHSITDNTQSNWNGIIGDIQIIQKDQVSISNIQIYPDVNNKLAKVKIEVNNLSGKQKQVKLEIHAESKSVGSPQKVKTRQSDFVIENGENTIEIDYPMGDNVRLWDEFNPNLYELSVDLKSNKSADSKTEIFGMREMKADNKRFSINNRPLFLRGTLECAIFPKTGFPPTNVTAWVRIINICKDHGLNHIRFHSWCPPEAAFKAADSLGFYHQIECSAWATVGDGEPIDKWIYAESNAIVDAYGNHPSFCLMAYGNEPGGKNHPAYLAEFVEYWKNKDSRRLYTAGAGWPIIPENEYHSSHRGTRIQGWGEELKSVINSQAPRSDYDWRETIKNLTAPMVSHEIGQWCVYPNLKETVKYDGILKAKNFEIFKRSLEAHGMLQLADSFLLASGKLQTLCYKADIEAALRTPGFGGFQLLDLHDFPGQGTALVGVLDPFWEEKGYVSPEEFRHFCNETVPLARFKKMILTGNENIEAEVEVAHYGPKELTGVKASWKILDNNNQLLKEGIFNPIDIPWGSNIKLGSISENINVEKAAKLRFEVEVAGFINSWDLWVFPSILQEKDNVLIVRKLDAKAISALQDGKNVLLTIEKGSIKDGKGGEVGIGFSSIFWNTAWTNGQKPHTLGILCNPKHPALADFPTEYHSNWQWWDAMSHSNAINIEGFSSTVTPIVRVIDDWVTNRSLALLFEAKVGNGKLIISGIDLQSDLETRPEARQLLFSLKNYMTGADFAPKVSLSINEIKDLMN